MSKRARSTIDGLRGASRLAIEATSGVTDLVEEMHRTIAAGPRVLGRPLDGVTRAVLAPVYGSIRAVTALVGTGIDVALAQLAPLVGESSPASEPAAVVAALNGVLGDYLRDTGNPLAIEMRLRHGGVPLVLERESLRAALPEAGAKLLVLVHGSCMSDLQWSWRGHDHGAALARDLGYTPVYLHYNSGLHVSTNGHTFAALLEQLVLAWPVPIDELVILAHSMGGLVTRSACHDGELLGHAWRRKLGKVIFLGTPHHGAPLERGGNWIDVLLQVSRYSAPLARLGKIRSAGVTDLRFGSILDEDWEGKDRFARSRDLRRPLTLPEGVECYAIAATTAPVTRKTLPGDGLVPLRSALGSSTRAEHVLAFPEARQWVAFGAGHLDLLDRPAVYETIRSWLDTRAAPAKGA
jgi:hypothetical protein